MTLKGKKMLTAAILVLTMIAGTCLAGFTYQDGIDGVYYEKPAKIFDGTYYYEQLGGHEKNGIERSYFVTSNLQTSGLIPYVFEGDVTGRYTMDSMIKNIEAQGFHVVSGINGDLFDTSSGASKGTVIHDGLIKTSGYAPEYGISFDDNGKASLVAVNMSYTIKGTQNVPATSTTTDESGQPQETTTYTEAPYSASIGYINVPHGAGKALHLYNRQYAPSTKVTEKSVEVVINTASVEAAQPRVGQTITGTVVGGKSSTTNTPIGDNQIVLSAAMDSSWAKELAQLAPGTQVEITANNNGSTELNNSKECIGVYYLLYTNGQYVTTGTNLNPRTCIGIKPDGTTMMYVNDGRQSGWSAGLGLTDVTDHLKALGCTTIVNMDGGGSTMMATRVAGVDNVAKLKNSPSDKSQRSVTNGLFFVYAGSGNGAVANLHPVAANQLVMPKGRLQLTTYASDDKYNKVAAPSNISYDVANGNGSVDEKAVFTAGDKAGVVEINANSGDATGSTKVEIVSNFDFKPSIDTLNIDPGESYDINLNTLDGYTYVTGSDDLFTWTCDSGIGTIDGNGVFTATKTGGVSGNITVSYGDKSKIIAVNVSGSSGFTDVQKHWAKTYIQDLTAKGIVNGMGNNMFFPDSPLTRAQFLKMLAMVGGEDVSKSPASGFSDVAAKDWFYDYVNWAYAKGIVKGMDETHFNPNSQISREQMAVMLVNFSNSINLTLPETVTGVSFTDGAKINSWSRDQVDAVVKAGIINGYPAGNFDPQGQATRAQASKVIYELCSIKDNAVASQ